MEKNFNTKHLKLQIDCMLKSYDKYYLTNFVNFINNRHNFVICEKKKLKIISQKIVSLPWKRNLYTVLRSPHVNKTARDQFEIRFYKKFIRFELEGNQEAIRFFINLLKINSQGVEMKISLTPKK